jgi:phospholipase/carboxylesterase
MTSITDFIHRYLPGAAPDVPTMLLLHGTGGDENALLDIGKQLLPGAALLSPRGRVSENGNARFFRRFAEGVLDVDDLVLQTHELAAFITDAATHYHFDLKSLTAVGYSNGANIATGLLFLHPGLLKQAVLFRPMLLPDFPAQPDLTGTEVLILAGRHDNLIPPDSAQALATLLQDYGASVTLQWQPVDHRLTLDDITFAQNWLAKQSGK